MNNTFPWSLNLNRALPKEVEVSWNWLCKRLWRCSKLACRRLWGCSKLTWVMEMWQVCSTWKLFIFFPYLVLWRDCMPSWYSKNHNFSLWKKMGMKLQFSSAIHFQTDGQIETINQFWVTYFEVLLRKT